MPTYSYRCQACKHEFEEFQKITDLPVKECPKCGGLVMRIITGGAGLIFKGAGFYITDNRQLSPTLKAPHKEIGAPKESEEKKALLAGPDNKPESKSETKSESKPDKKETAD